MAALGLDIRRHAVQNQRVQLLLHMLAVVVSTCGIEQLQPARALSHSHAHAAGTTCTDLGFSGLQLCSDCKLMSTIVTNNGKPKTKDEKKEKRKRKIGGIATRSLRKPLMQSKTLKKKCRIHLFIPRSVLRPFGRTFSLFSVSTFVQEVN